MTDSPTPWAYLKRARLRAGYTPTTAAAALNVSLTHYCSAEKGRRGLSDLTLIAAARLFNVDVVELAESRPQSPPRTNASCGDSSPAVA